MATKEKEHGTPGVVPSSERNTYNELKKTTADPRAEEVERAYRSRALQNLSSDSGVFKGNQADIEREVARLKIEDAQNN